MLALPPFGDGAIRNWPRDRIAQELAKTRADITSSVRSGDMDLVQTLCSKAVGFRLCLDEIKVTLKPSFMMEGSK